MFFSLDGIDGGGKSTQLDLFCSWLRESGHDVVICRDPGTTQLGEAIRDILLTKHDIDMARCSEMLLYMAARAQLVAEIVQPALSAGKVVVSDRYSLANVVYQGYGGQLDVDTIWKVGRIATGGLLPDLTIVLDMDVRVAVERIQRDMDRMESQGDEFAQRVRRGYLTEAGRDPDRIIVIDAAREIEQVQFDIRAAASKALLPANNNQQSD